MEKTKNLTQGPIGRQLVHLALPIMGTLFIQMAYNLIDMAWVGRLGSRQVAVVGAAGILVWMTNSLSLLNKTAAEVNVGQSIGSRDTDAARAYASHVLSLGLLMSVVWACFLFFCAGPVMRLFGMEASLTTEAASFLRILTAGFPFLFLSAACTGIYNAAGLSKIPFYVNGAGLLLNIVLDPVFIFLLHLGTAGAAMATCLSQAVVFGLFALRLRGKNRLLGGFPFLTRFRLKYVARILHVGLPVALLNALFSCINLLMGRIASLHGGHIGLMTMTTGGQIEGLAWYTSQGFSTALSTFVAQNFAAGKQARLLSAWRLTLGITSAVGLFCGFLFFFFGTNIFALIVPEPDAYEAGGIFLRIDAYSMLLMMVEITMQGVFYGTGRSLPPALISIGFNLLRLPLAGWLGTTSLGLTGVWWAISISSMLKGLTSFLWFKFSPRLKWSAG
jgi:putative MATE family efflux protein